MPVSLARIAQYHSLVVVFTLAAIICFFCFHQGGGRSRRWHGLGTFLFAAAFLMHFEVLLLGPVLLYLSVAHLGWPGRTGWATYLSRLRPFWTSPIIFGAMLSAFYVPLLLNPAIEKTGTYLENRIGGDVPPFNNL
ncbi:MAG: hypothetical protein R3264_19715, partial [Anaerolineae bacterium]|nr:hypothetical protein [Anaerolineae bacterium]